MASNNSNQTVNLVMTRQMKKEVLSKVSIPMYFYNIIVPQLGSYYDLYPVDFDNKPVVCCPLHDEDTPSCRYYPETESFYCFGCQKGGNVINLHKYFVERMNGTSIEYDAAVEFLYTFFIKGKENVEILQPTQQTLDKPVEKSTNVELMRFTSYTKNLNQLLMQDDSVSQTVKHELWDVIDTMDLLVSKNEIGAKDAQEYIQLKVKELVR